MEFLGISFKLPILKMQKFLFISTLSSSHLIDEIYKSSRKNLGFAVQKFNRLLVEGFQANGVNVSTISSAPLSSEFRKEYLYKLPSENIDGVDYNYTPYCRLSFLKRILAFSSVFFTVLFWGLGNKKEKTIVCDVLNISICAAAIFASKLIGLRSIGIVTDMPGLMVSSKKKNLKSKIYAWINQSYLHLFSSYVFLTEAMNDVVNTRHKPFIIMEGLVNHKDNHKNIIPAEERDKSIIYAGGVFEEYGVKSLVEAFININNLDFTLNIYGSGPMEDWLKKISKEYPQVKYHGVRPNSEVVEAERKALLLVNPRPSSEEFTKYSFPSKNMEYMQAGTTVLTNPLPGMPKEYHPYVFLFSDETISGYEKTLNTILSIPSSDLVAKANQAHDWVLKNKNNVAQTKRIIDKLIKHQYD